MPPTSSLGAGAPKQRTINVEVNLLSEWMDSRNRLREERTRWTAILTSVALLAVIMLPLLGDLAAQQQARARRAIRFAKDQAGAVAQLSAELDRYQPQIDGEATYELCRGRSRIFMNQTLAVLNAATPRMVVESIEASVIAGEMGLRVKAQAETYELAQRFVANAGQGNRVKSSILASVRQKPSLGPGAVTFEFAKKVSVGP